MMKTLKYLGLTFDEQHLAQICRMAEGMCALVSMLSYYNDTILTGLVHSIILYGTPMWSDVCKYAN